MIERRVYEWEKDLEGVSLNDKRLNQRLIKIMEKLSASPGQSIYLASGTRKEAKAVYRFMSNEKVRMTELLEGVKKATATKIKESEEEVILAIQDTTSLSYGRREKIEGMGYYCDSKQKGMNVHTTIAVTGDGIPLGTLHQEYQTREARRDQSASKEEKKRRPIEEKESYWWLTSMIEARKGIPEGVKVIHICDREGDFYELFDIAEKNSEVFLIRISQNRPTWDGKKIITDIKQKQPKGTLMVRMSRNPKTNIPMRNVLMNYTYQQYTVNCPQRRKEERLEKHITLTGIYVWEAGVPKEKAIHWILVTNDDIIENNEMIVSMIGYYAQRWKIERFHYILKNECKIEEKQARSYKRLCLLTLIYSLIAMRILNITYIGRLLPDMPCHFLLNEDEWKILYCIANKTKQVPDGPYTLREAIKYIAALAGSVGAPSDGFPGAKVIGLGLKKLLFVLACREFIL